MSRPANILPTAAARFGDAAALITDDTTLKYEDLNRLSDAVAAALISRGVVPGEVVSLYAQNCWQWIVAYHGALKSGAVVNPVNVMLTADELGYVLNNCGATVLFVDSGLVEVARAAGVHAPSLRTIVSFSDDGTCQPDVVAFPALISEANPLAAPVSRDCDSPAVIGYTSGTTGHPKGAVQSHRAVHLNIALTAAMHGRTERDVVVTALPAAHVYGNVAINSTFMVGGTVVLMSRFNPTAALRLIGHHHATMFEGVPAMYAMMLADANIDNARLASLTRCTVGGQTMPVPQIEQWQQLSGCRLIELWGMTEISGLGATHALHTAPKPGSIGYSLPGMQFRVVNVDDSTQTVPVNESGELMVRGPLVMSGYHDNPEATSKAFDSDGWLHTGDIATQDEHGYLYLVDRLNDMIITGGYNIYPAEIERVLSGHPAIAHVAVGPVPDPVKGELACAYVVPNTHSNLTEHDVIQFAAQRLAAYKRPRRVRFVATLPTTSTGKVMRRKLIDTPLSETNHPASPATPRSTKENP